MNRTAPQGTVSKSLLDIIASSKHEEQPSKSLLAALGSKTVEGTTTTTDEQFKLLDLVSSESAKEREAVLEAEQELFKPLPKPAVKQRSYSLTRFNKEQIKLGAEIQCKQQRQKAEELLQQDVQLELTQEEIEDKARKEEAKQKRAEWYERRTREKEEKEEEEAGNVLEDIVVQGSDATSARSSKIMDTSKPVRPKNP